MPNQTAAFADSIVLPQKLFEQLVAAPIVEVTGVVDGRGAATFRAVTDPSPTLIFRLDYWRIGGGLVQGRPLTILWRETDAKLNQLRRWLDPYVVRRFRAHFVNNSLLGSPQAFLVELVGPEASDPELNEYADKMQQPVVHNDSEFGALVLERRYDWYTAKAIWNDKPIELKIQAEKEGDLPASLRTAHRLWQNQVEWNVRILDHATAELLQEKNAVCRESNDPEVTADQFRSSIVWKTVLAKPDGIFEFWSIVDVPFHDEQIRVGGDLSDGSLRAAVK